MAVVSDAVKGIAVLGIVDVEGKLESDCETEVEENGDETERETKETGKVTLLDRRCEDCVLLEGVAKDAKGDTRLEEVEDMRWALPEAASRLEADA